MSAVWWFILGLLVGWLLEWVIDWVYWRRRLQDFYAEFETLRSERDTLRGERETLRSERDTARVVAQRFETELRTLRESSSGVTTERDRLQAEIASLRDAHIRAQDEYEHMQANLAALNTQIAQITAENDQLHAALADAHQAGQDLERLRSERDTAHGRLQRLHDKMGLLFSGLGAAGAADGLARAVSANDNAAQQTLAFSGGSTDGTSAASLEDHLDTLHARLAAALADNEHLRTTLAQTQAPPADDPLIDIVGIGPIYEKRLKDAGIRSFAALAQCAPERLRELVAAEEWQDLDAESWITQAHELALKSGKERA